MGSMHHHPSSSNKPSPGSTRGKHGSSQKRSSSHYPGAHHAPPGRLHLHSHLDELMLPEEEEGCCAEFTNGMFTPCLCITVGACLLLTGLGLGLLLHDLILGPHSFFFRRSQCVGHSSHVPCVYPSGFDSNNPDGSSGSSGLRAFNWQDPNQTAITLIMFAQLRYLGIDLSPQQQLLHDQLRLNQQITAVKALEAGESLAPPSSGGSGSHGSPPPSVSIMLQPRTPMQLAPQPSPGGQQQQQQQQQEGKNGKGQDQKHEAVKPGSTRKLSKQEEEEERQRLRGISHRPGSTGILMVGGGKDVLGNAVVTLRLMRSPLIRCTLPVEVVYQAADEKDQPDPAVASMLQEPGLRPLTLVAGHHKPDNGSMVVHTAGRGVKGNYAFKVYALAFLTTFQHVLLLDTDSMPLKDPATLFKSSEYLTYGNLFWPDYWHDDGLKGSRPSKGTYRLFNMPVPWEWDDDHRTAESGQVLLDRGRHWDVLHWLWLLNSHPDPLKQYLHGDKDSFLIAFYMAGKAQEYQQVRWFPREVIATKADSRKRYRHAGMLQMFPDGTPGFHHRTADVKFFPWCLKGTRNGDQTHCKVTHISSPLSPPQALLLSDSKREGCFYPEDMHISVWQDSKCTGDRGRAGAPIPAPAWALARHRVGQLWAHLNMTALALNATASSPGTDASPAPAADDEARRLMSGRALVDSMPEGQSAGDNIRVTTAGSRSDIGISGAGSSLTIRRHLSETTSNSSSHSNHSSAEPPGTSPAAAPSMPLVTKELRSALPDLGCLPPAGEFAGIGSEDKPPQIPAWEVSHFPAVHAVIQRAYEIYEEVASRPPFSSTSKNG